MNIFNILAVDDDQSLTKLLKYNLEGGGVQVMEAKNGLECLNLVKQVRVDLVVLDLRLPDFNGWGILSLLRLTDWLKQIPVVIVSVESPDQPLVGMFAPEDYIQKPFDTRDLLSRIKRVMTLKAACS